MELTEKKLRQVNSYSGIIVDVTLDQVELCDGHRAFREVVHHPGGVTVLPLDDEGFVYCVRQYRYAHGVVMLEIPAGKLDSKEEDHVEAALRELREETGAVAEKYTDLGYLLPSPAVLSERIRMYLAEDMSFTECDPDDDEFLNVVKIPLDELYGMVMRGEIEDAKTQIAVLKVWELKNRK